MALMVMYVLKHITHCEISVIFLHLLSISDFPNTSSSVASGMPNRGGSSSCSSINSPRQILSAILRWIGGEHGPTVIASVELLRGGPDAISAPNDHEVKVVTLPLLDVSELPSAVEVALENVFTELSAVELGITPIVGGVAVVVPPWLPVEFKTQSALPMLDL